MKLKRWPGWDRDNYILAGVRPPPLQEMCRLVWNDLDGKLGVLFMHKRVVRVRKDRVAAQLVQTLDLRCQLDVILFVNCSFRVPFEIRVFRDGEIGQIKKHKIAGPGVLTQARSCSHRKR